MEENQNSVYLQFNELENTKIRKRDLLTWWIKAFTWIFMFFGAIIPLGLIIGLMGQSFSISLYGFETTNPFSLIGIFLIFLFLIKGVTAFGLWTEKKWAVDLGIFDAILGLIACGIAMIVLPFIDYSEGFVLNFRLEPILLVLYLIKLQKIRPLWQ